MTTLKKENMEAVHVINNPESVIEVYLNKEENKIVEKKRLNGNRYKTYNYELDEYLGRYRHHFIAEMIKKRLN